MKTKLIIIALALLTGCTSVPPVIVTPVAAEDCRAVQGAPIKMTRDGRAAHKYICNGVGVWAVQL